MDNEAESKPFKLTFVEKILPGRSTIQIGKPLKLAPLITSKFYCKYEIEPNCSEEYLKEKIDYLNPKGPREKFDRPITENQRYGWYQVRLTDLDLNDKRLHHPIHFDSLITEHLMNYTTIR